MEKICFKPIGLTCCHLAESKMINAFLSDMRSGEGTVPPLFK